MALVTAIDPSGVKHVRDVLWGQYVKYVVFYRPRKAAQWAPYSFCTSLQIAETKRQECNGEFVPVWAPQSQPAIA